MKIRRFSISIVAAAVLAFGGSSAWAGSVVSRTNYMNANMWSWIDHDTGMSWSIWHNSTKTTERHGGRPETQEYTNSGYCFYINTCPPAGGQCMTEKQICGELGPDDLLVAGDTIRFIRDGFVFNCSIDRHASSSSNRRNIQFDGSSDESHAKSHSTEGRGTLSGVEGFFEGYCYSNDGVNRQKTVN